MFELKKRTVSNETEETIVFKISVGLKDIYNQDEGSDLKSRIAEMGLADKVTFTASDKMRLDASIVREWFKESIKEIINHIVNLLAEDKMGTVQKILLVGGFGECQLVQEEIRSRLQNKRLLVPDGAGLAVLKGAVGFGYTPHIVSSRVMKYTYGFKIVERNEEEPQYGSDRAVNFNFDSCLRSNNERLTKFVFDKFVGAGDEVPIGHEVKRVYIPRNPRRIIIPVFCTQDPFPRLVTDPGSEHLGDLPINLPDGETCEDNMNEVTLIFGDTEVIVKAKVIRTVYEFLTRLDCLK